MHPSHVRRRAHVYTATQARHRWGNLAAKYPNTLAVHDPHHDDEQLTFSQLHQAMLCFASGLQALGLMPGDIVSLFSENSARWLIADAAVMLNGAADAARGFDGVD